MDISAVIEVISTLGFPIALSVAMGWMFFKIFTWQRIDAKEREAKDRDTLERFSGIISTTSQALLKNSEALQQVAEKLSDMDAKIEDMKMDITEIKFKQNNKN